MKDILQKLDKSKSAFQVVENIEEELINAKYEKLDPTKEFNIKKGKKYYITRNGSSVIAFNIGKSLKNPSLLVAASHTDCPSFKIKPEAFIFGKDFLQLNTEVYGGPLMNPWFDRPLSIAGRVMVKNKGIKSINFVDDEPFCIIPSVCIHFDREANTGKKLNPQIDLLPLVSGENADFKDYLSKKLKTKKENILGFDLYLYPQEKAIVWGMNKEFFSSFHIDNAECAYTTLEGFIDNFNDENINVYASFDNEEVGSNTRQGAASDFLETTLKRVCEALKIDYYSLLGKAMMLSCDNAHSVHPNHPELSDPKNRPVMNKGVVIKQNANQSYTSDGLSIALFSNLLDQNKVPYQFFTNRSDIRGGGTLGNISNQHVSIMAVDIGLAQLAMHSCYETAGVKDVEYMIKAIKAFYKANLKIEKDTYYLD